MDSAPIDYLLQIPPVRTEGAIAPPRSRDDGPPFDRHFQQASDLGGTLVPTRAKADSHETPRKSLNNDRRPSESHAMQGPPTAKAPSSTVGEKDAGEKTDQSDSEESAIVATGGAVKPTDEPAAIAEDAQAAKVLTVDATSEPKARSKQSHVAIAKQSDAAGLPGGEASKSASTEVVKPPNEATIGPDKSSAGGRGEAPAQLDAFVSGGEASREEVAADVVQTSIDAVTTEEKPGKFRLTTKPRRDVAAKNATGETSQRTSVASASAKTSGTTDAVQETTATPGQVVESRASSDLHSQSFAGETSADARDQAAPKSEPTNDEQLGVPAPRPAAARTVVAPPTAVAANVAPNPADRSAAQNTPVEATAPTKKVASDSQESILTTFVRFERGSAFGGRSAHRAGETHSAPHVDPARFVGRVARAIQTAQDRGAPLLLRLSPPELGSLRLELSLQQGMLSATVETDNQNARQLLLDNLPALRDRLADQNIRIERFDVDVRRDGEGREQPTFNPQQQQREQHHHRAAHRPGTTPGPTADDILETIAVIPQSITNTSINVVA